jgi:hypothetical protein
MRAIACLMVGGLMATSAPLAYGRTIFVGPQ